jgi:hypothetical protein
LKYFFPDSHDYVDPTFNFETEVRNEYRVIQRDDKYAHEIFTQKVYDGIVISKSSVDGVNGVKGRYSNSLRQCFLKEGIYRFMRLPTFYDTMGESGAFAYVAEPEPIYTVDELNEFYSNSGVTYGNSLDHIIFDFETINRKISDEKLIECQMRQEINLSLAEETKGVKS